MERWLLRGNRNSASGLIADLNERVATPVMFGGGTLAVVLNAGCARGQERGPRRDARDDDGRRAGQRAGHPRCEPVGSEGADPEAAGRRGGAAAGGVVRQFQSPKGGALAGWIEAEARERGLTLAPGTAKLLAERIGGNVQEADAERRHQTRIASMELDKLAPLPRHRADRPR